jgi:hypothetical protein
MLVMHLASNEDTQMSATTPTESKTIQVDPREYHVPTGIILKSGQRYAFTATGEWKDWTKTCDHRGWHHGWMTRFARVKGASLFQLCGAIGKNDRTLFAIDTRQTWTVPDALPTDDDQQLYLFANDWRIMYFNNRELPPEEGGPMRVTITRVVSG